MAKGTKDVAVGFCLDETLSMADCWAPTIEGFNAYVESLKGQDGKTTVTLTQFSATHSEPRFRTVHNATDIGKVAKLTTKTYRPRGNTPLFDAIGHPITSLAAETKGSDVSVIVVIQTDGEENASVEYSRDDIVKLIRKKEKKGWLFVYLGANQDAVTAERLSTSMGMSQGASFDYAGSDSAGVFVAMASSTGHARMARASGQNVNSASITDTAKAAYNGGAGAPVGKVWDAKSGSWVNDPDA